MELRTENQLVLIVTDYIPEGRPIQLMPIKTLWKLQLTVRKLYPDVSVAIRPSGDLELLFREPFAQDAPLTSLEQELKGFLADRGYKV